MRLTIGKKLGLGFGAMIFLILAVSAFVSIQIFRTNAKQDVVLNTEVPGVQAALRVKGDVSHALALHRGYMILGLESLAEERLETWEDIHRDMGKLEAVSAKWSPEEQAKMERLKQVMAAYKASQQRIAEVCQTPSNEPANVVYFERAAPRGDAMSQHLDAVLALEENLDATPDRKALVRSVADAKGHLLASSAAISRYLATGTEADKQAVDEAIAACGASVERLRGASRLFTPEQRQQFDHYLNEREAFLAAADEAVVIRSGPGWNVAEEICLNEVTPLASRAQEILTGMVDVQEARLTEDGQVLAAKAKSMKVGTIAAAIVATAIGVGVALFLSSRIVSALNAVVARAREIAANDLTGEPLATRSNDEIGDLTEAVNAMSASLRDIVAEVTRATEEVSGAATEIAASSEEIATGMDEQTAQVTQVSSAVEEMSASVTEVAKKSTDASSNAKASGELAERGGATVCETIEGMNSISAAVTASAEAVKALGKRGEEIGEIIEVINDIADQTNLLALNAAIEAARAGEHGRGFAVVADEVRKLADRTTRATEEIAESIRAIQDETNQAVARMDSGVEEVTAGVAKAGSAGQSLDQIMESSRDVAGMIQGIAAAAEQQAAAAEEISHTIQSIASITAQANEGTRQAATAGAQLSNRAESLQALVQRFRV